MSILPKILAVCTIAVSAAGCTSYLPLQQGSKAIVGVIRQDSADSSFEVCARPHAKIRDFQCGPVALNSKGQADITITHSEEFTYPAFPSWREF
jgi:hypothetical protein